MALEREGIEFGDDGWVFLGEFSELFLLLALGVAYQANVVLQPFKLK